MYDPGIPLTNFNDRGGGGVQQRFIFYTKKSQLQNLSTSKNHYFFLAYPKKFLCYYFFLATQKITLAKISDPKNHSDPPVIKISEWGSGSPGGGGVLNLSLGRGVPPGP